MNVIKEHGTKVIGYVGTAASILAAADPVMVQALIGERGPFIVTAALSFLTILRGHQNSRRNPQ